MWIYHNTILAGDTPRYDYGCDGLIHGLARGTSRRVFNNIVCLTEGTPGTTLPPADADFAADGNLFWSLKPDKELAKDPFGKFRAGQAFERSKTTYSAGWTANDQAADPRFERLDGEFDEENNLSPGDQSPATDRGIVISRDWPDPIRERQRRSTRYWLHSLGARRRGLLESRDD